VSRDNDYGEGFQAGAEYVLHYLADVFEGVEDTDVWAEFMSETE
jgi:hypothetical protein